MTQLAAKENRRAMLSLYESHKKTVYFVCRYLMVDEERAKEAAAKVYEDLWEELSGGTVIAESELRQHLLKNAVKICQQQLGAAAFGAEKFTAEMNRTEGTDDCQAGEYIVWLLENLPERQRACFLLYTVADVTARQTAELLKLDLKETETQWKAMENQIVRQLTDFKVMDSIGSLNYSVLCEEVEVMAKEAKVPLELDNRVQTHILETTKARYRRKTRITVITVVAAVVVCIAVAVLIWTLTRKVYTYKAEIEIQDYGTITVGLDEEAAPATVENFIALAESGFYDGLTFHRIIEGFMMQGGDPNGDGSGGSGENIVGEFAYNGYTNDLSHTRGAISMARSSDYNSASSQFFIVHEDSTFLDGQYAVFGYVLDGIEIVDQVCADAEPVDSNGTILTDAQPVITTIRIIDESSGS